MLRNNLVASAAHVHRGVAATSTTSSLVCGYVVTRTASSSSSRHRPRPPHQGHRRQSGLTYRLFEKAGFDVEEAEWRREDALANGQPLDPEEQGWKRSGISWKVRRGNMIARHPAPQHRRGYATVAGQAAPPQPLAPRRPPGEMRPGDLVQYPSVDGYAWGIVMPCAPVRHLFQTKQFFALSSFGTMTLLKQSAVVMHLPGLLASEGADAKRATIGHKEAMLLVEEATGLAPKDDVAAAIEATVGFKATSARARMAAALRRVVKESDDELDSLRGRLATVMAKESLLQRDEISVDEVAAELAGQDPAPTSTLIATHTLLTSMPRYFIHLAPAKAYKVAQTYAIRPQRERDLVDQIEAWRRTDGSPIDAFVAAVKAGRKNIDTTQHSALLTFLVNSLTSGSEGQTDIYAPGVDDVLKRCDRLAKGEPAPYGQALWLGIDKSRERRQTAVIKLLEDVGAFARDATDWSLASTRSARWLASAAKRSGSGVGANLATDLDAKLRKPFTAPVFVIDDATAHELDDGVSVEPASQQDGSVWVHVHIADPTSHLQPDDLPAQLARRQGSTLYLSNGASVPMFPPRSTKGIDEADERGVRRAMTLSARISAQGEVEETSVGLSALEGEVRKVTYDDVDAGRAGHGEEFKRLASVAELLLEARMRDGALFINDVDSRVRASVSSGASAPQIAQASSLGADTPTSPALLLSTSAPSPARSHVAECMILAGRIASDFLWRRNNGTAAVYRAQRFPEQIGDQWKAALRKQTGALGRADVLKMGIAMSSAVSRSTPDEHVSMGISSGAESGTGDLLAGSGYLRVTSPLRRYEDVVAHWQIKSVLHGREATAFSLAELDAELPDIARRAETVQAVSNGSSDWFKHKALRLAFEGERAVKGDDEGWRAISHADLRKPLRAYVVDGSMAMDSLALCCTTRVTLPELGRGVNAECLWPMSEEEAAKGAMPKMGQEVEVEVVGIRESIDRGGSIAVRVRGA